MYYLAIDYLKYRMIPIDDLIGTGLKQKSMAEVPLEDISYYAVEDADVVYQLSTILKDNSQLNCRIKGLEKYSPTRFVLD